jgi:hypothetical protein
MGLNVFDPSAGFAVGQEQVWGFSLATAIDQKVYLAPGSKIFYVDPNNPQAVDFGNLGEDPSVPLATVQAAVVLCRDHRGDIIVVGANDAWQYGPHNRPLPIAESIIIPSTKGGIKIIGAGTNPMAVQWQAAASNSASITIRAIDVLIEGIGFIEPMGLANTTGIYCEWDNTDNCYGENLTVRNCMFWDLDYGISFEYSWYCQVYNNRFETINVAAILNASVTGDCDFLTVHDNTFAGCALALTLTTVEECAIYNNRIRGNAAGTNNFINLTGGNDNLVADNFLGCTIAQYDVTCSDATSGQWINNHCTNGDTAAPPV